MYHNLVTRPGSPFAANDVGVGLNARDWADSSHRSGTL